MQATSHSSSRSCDGVGESEILGHEDPGTETIDLAGLFNQDITSSGSFDFRGVESSVLAQLLDALPLPSFLLNSSHIITFANEACGHGTDDPKKLHGVEFSRLFSRGGEASEAGSLIDKVLGDRTSRVCQFLLTINRKRVWGRTHFRSLRFGRERAVMILVEDLTPETKQLLLKERHRDELQKAHDRLEERVGERTAELVEANERLTAEISRRKRIEEALRASEQRMRLVIESSPVGIRVARKGKYIYCNPAFVKMFGYDDPGEILGLTVADLYAPHQRELLRALMRDPGRDRRVPSYYEAEGVKKNGERFDLAVWIAETEYDGEPSYLGFLTDISEAKRLRAQLLQAQKMEAIGILAGGVAHDFNNLLTVIQGFADLVLSEKDHDHPDYADLQKIAQSAQKGADLVHSLLAFSRKVEINLRPVKLNQAVEQIRRLLLRTLPKMIEIKTVLPEDLKLIHADIGQIEQVILNLAVNAKDAMPNGGRLLIESKSVVVSGESYLRTLDINPGAYVVLSVSDTGRGMNKEVLSHIFEPFYTTKGPKGGTGLGLAMVYGIVKEHRGHITCYSEPEHGTTFNIYLPAIDENEAEHVELTDEEKPLGGTETILLVDDEEPLRDLGTRMLSRAGYDVLTAANGKEALDVLAMNSGKTISLVILDLIMPEMDGRQCLERLLRMDPGTRILISSGFSDFQTVRLEMGNRARGYVAKPFRSTDLLKTVRNVLDGS